MTVPKKNTVAHNRGRKRKVPGTKACAPTRPNDPLLAACRPLGRSRLRRDGGRLVRAAAEPSEAAAPAGGEEGEPGDERRAEQDEAHGHHPQLLVRHALLLRSPLCGAAHLQRDVLVLLPSPPRFVAFASRCAIESRVRKFPKWFGSGESSDEYAAAGLELEAGCSALLSSAGEGPCGRGYLVTAVSHRFTRRGTGLLLHVRSSRAFPSPAPTATSNHRSPVLECAGTGARMRRARVRLSYRVV
jgi:hypothetical protein